MVNHAAWKKYFDEFSVHGTFLIRRIGSDTTDVYNRPRCDSGFIPASSFKILNSLVAFETGVIPDAATLLQWDSVQRSIPAWNKDQNIAEAFTNSTVWFYQEIARRVGRERMQHWLDTVGYGNRDISGPIDSFWLSGKLRITPLQQLAFIERFCRGRLPFSGETMAQVREIFPRQVIGTDTVYGKTGWGQVEGKNIGWLVGYLRQGANVYCYVTNIESSEPDSRFPLARREITAKIFRALGLLKADK